MAQEEEVGGDEFVPGSLSSQAFEDFEMKTKSLADTTRQLGDQASALHMQRAEMLHGFGQAAANRASFGGIGAAIVGAATGLNLNSANRERNRVTQIVEQQIPGLAQQQFEAFQAAKIAPLKAAEDAMKLEQDLARFGVGQARHSDTEARLFKQAKTTEERLEKKAHFEKFKAMVSGGVIPNVGMVKDAFGIDDDQANSYIEELKSQKNEKDAKRELELERIQANIDKLSESKDPTLKPPTTAQIRTLKTDIDTNREKLAVATGEIGRFVSRYPNISDIISGDTNLSNRDEILSEWNRMQKDLHGAQLAIGNAQTRYDEAMWRHDPEAAKRIGRGPEQKSGEAPAPNPEGVEVEEGMFKLRDSQRQLATLDEEPQSAFTAYASDVNKKLPSGYRVEVTSGRRTTERQQQLFDKHGPGRAAHPDRSQHVQSGGALDVGVSFNGKPVAFSGLSDDLQAIFHQNAEKYGFRFPHKNAGTDRWHMEYDSSLLDDKAEAPQSGGSSESSSNSTSQETVLSEDQRTRLSETLKRIQQASSAG